MIETTRELVGDPFPRPAARAHSVQEEDRRAVVRAVDLDVEADTVPLDPSRLDHAAERNGFGAV